MLVYYGVDLVGSWTLFRINGEVFGRTKSVEETGIRLCEV